MHLAQFRVWEMIPSIISSYLLGRDAMYEWEQRERREERKSTRRTCLNHHTTAQELSHVVSHPYISCTWKYHVYRTLFPYWIWIIAANHLVWNDGLYLLLRPLRMLIDSVFGIWPSALSFFSLMIGWLEDKKVGGDLLSLKDLFFNGPCCLEPVDETCLSA